MPSKSRKSSSIRPRSPLGVPLQSGATVPVRLPNQIAPAPPGTKVPMPTQSPNGRIRAAQSPDSHGRIAVILNGVSVSTRPGSRVVDLIGQRGVKSGLPTLGAVVNGRLRPLDHPLVSNCTVRTVEFGTKDGSAIYIRTVVLVLCEAVRDIDPNLNPVVGQSLAGGYSFSLRRSGARTDSIDPGLIRQIKKRMLRIIAEDRPVVVRRVTVEEALDY